MSINIDHISLRVSNLSQAKAFYYSLFKFANWKEVTDPNDEMTMGYRSENGFTLWLDEEVHSLETGSKFGWLDHFGLKCDSRLAVDQAFDFCSSQNWNILSKPKEYPDYGNFYGFSFAGPDGIKLEFVTR